MLNKVVAAIRVSHKAAVDLRMPHKVAAALKCLTRKKLL